MEAPGLRPATQQQQQQGIGLCSVCAEGEAAAVRGMEPPGLRPATQQQQPTVFTPPPPPPQQQGFVFGGSGAAEASVVRSPRGMMAAGIGPRLGHAAAAAADGLRVASATAAAAGVRVRRWQRWRVIGGALAARGDDGGGAWAASRHAADAAGLGQQPTLAPPPAQQPQQNQGVGFGGTGAGAATTVSPAPRGTTMARERAAEQLAYDDAISRLINKFAGHDKDAIQGKNTSNVQVFDDIHEGDAIRMAELEEFEKQVLALNAAAWNDAASSCGEEPAVADNFLNGEEQREEEEEEEAAERRSWTLERWELELKASRRRVVEANERARGVQRERERVRRQVAALLQQRMLKRQQMSALSRERALAHKRFVLQQRQWRQQMVEQQQQQQRAPMQQQRMPVVQQAAPRKPTSLHGDGESGVCTSAPTGKHARGAARVGAGASQGESCRRWLHFCSDASWSRGMSGRRHWLRQRAQLEQAALQEQLKLEMQQMRRRQEQRQRAPELAIMPQPQGHRARGGGTARHPDAAIAQGGSGVGHNHPPRGGAAARAAAAASAAARAISATDVRGAARRGHVERAGVPGTAREADRCSAAAAAAAAGAGRAGVPGAGAADTAATGVGGAGRAGAAAGGGGRGGGGWRGRRDGATAFVDEGAVGEACSRDPCETLV
ncbi:hypothetical protein OsJ_14606 [Oryza sativa Japonica Group]|uniref:Uncharacterized protein n=1 Tax=Oryza sativa subsp. japonica TaxID=39947 RepID=A3ATB7_ORYSJ|nr:hypothetical protein OsJ_14606 [Oryza sativa Japonica Group]